ncbi:MAG: T9SS type A sorting domain-containing protein [Acidimicrobiia bacterium]
MRLRIVTGMLTLALSGVAVLAWVPPALGSPTITLDPSEGPAGSVFLVEGNGFPAGEKIRIRWEDKSLGPPVVVNASGGFSVFRTVPVDATPGDYLVSAVLQPGGNIIVSATFTVVVDSTTTTTALGTTTTTQPAATTTTTASATTTTAPSATTTPGAGTTTTEAGLVFVVEFSADPPEGPPGTEFELEARFVGPIKRVKIWMGDVRLGRPVAVTDGKLRATLTVPDLESGLYWLRIETNDGEIITARSYEVVAEDSSLANPGSQAALSLRSPAYLILAGLLLVALLSVWWMWRKPKEEEGAPQATVSGPDDTAPPPGTPEG